MPQKPKQDMKRKAETRRKRNASGKNTDFQAAKRRGDEGVGSKSKSAQSHRATRAKEKVNGKKTPKGKDIGHVNSLKSGGSNNPSNTRVEDKSSNRSKGGKSGSRKGKAQGGRKSRK